MSTFWRCIERYHGGSAVPASWRKHLGPDFDRAKPFLSATGNEATSFPSANFCECWLRVVRHGPDDIVGISDCETSGCDDVSLTAADLALYEFNLKKFSRAVVSALQFEWRDKDIGIYGARQIGAFGAASMPIILAVHREQQAFADAMQQIVLHAGKHFVVLSPTSRFWNVTLNGLFDRANAGFFPLDSLMSVLPSGLLHARQNASELFPRFSAKSGEPTKTTEAARVFELVRKLKSESANQKASLFDVFNCIVLDGLNKAETAKQCGCAASLISLRVKDLERAFGMPVETLRNFASDVRDMESSVRGDRLAKKKHGAVSRDANDFADDSDEETDEDEE